MVGAAALGIWIEMDAATEDDSNTWYQRQHLPERLSVPGFLRGRRYLAVAGDPPYFTLYETADRAVLGSAPYLERLNGPTDWTRRVLPSWRRMSRNAYRLVAATADDRVERHVATIRVKPESGRGPAVRAWFEREAPAALTTIAGVTAGGLYEADTAGTGVVTEERRIMRAEMVAAPPFLAVCEVADPGGELPLREFWGTWAATIGAEVTVDLYRLMYGLAWLSPAVTAARCARRP